MKVFEWDDLRFFLAVLRGRSVRAASKLLGVSHSTVSRRLQAMEQQLGVKLFRRQKEGFVLTEIGEAMVERAERIESEVLSLEREIFGRDALLSGPIRISAPPLVAQFLLVPIVAEFAALYPEITIEIDATFEVADLRRRNADIAIRFQIEPEDNLVGHRLPDFANAVYSTREYLAQYTITGPQPTGRWVVLGSRETLASWRHDSEYRNCKVHHQVTDPLLHVKAVKEGMGIGYLFCFMADKEPQLVRVPGAIADQAITAWVLTHPDLVTTERVRVCVRFLADAIFKNERLIGGQLIS